MTGVQTCALPISLNNSRKRKKSKPKRSKKILNEEFDLEEEDITDTNSKPTKGVKQKKRYHRKKPKTKTSSGEVNYNSEEYHKKQHKF